MPERVTRRSPIQHLLEARGAELREFNDSCFAVRIQPEEVEAQASETLAMCDLSGLQKLGVKGRDADDWLRSNGTNVPAGIFETAELPESGVIVRVGADEFFLEEGIGSAMVKTLSTKVDSHDGEMYRVEHEEATFLLVGTRADKVLAQTCGINFRKVAAHQVVFTRVAGVSCGVYQNSTVNPAWRFWVDPAYAEYLWETLVEICESLDGQVIGVGCLYPQLVVCPH